MGIDDDDPPIILRGWDYYDRGSFGGVPGIFGGEPIVAELLGGNESGGGGGGGGDPEPPEDPTDLNPCEKKLALLHTNVYNAPALSKSRKIAEKWEADNGGPQDDNWVNAVKHCIWSCEMTQRMGYKAAEKWGTAHECDKDGNPQSESSDPKLAASSKMDLHNNEVGRFYGEKFPNLDCLTSCKTDTYGKLQPSP